jgi:hypothetical protein
MVQFVPKNLKIKDEKMSKPLLKKEIAAQAGMSMRTMQRHPKAFSFLNRCQLRRPGRTVYDSARVEQEMRRRKMIF